MLKCIQFWYWFVMCRSCWQREKVEVETNNEIYFSGRPCYKLHCYGAQILTIFTSKARPEVWALLNWSEDELVSDTLSDVIRKYVNKVCFRMETKYVDKVCFRMESFANSFLATHCTVHNGLILEYDSPVRGIFWILGWRVLPVAFCQPTASFQVPALHPLKEIVLVSFCTFVF